jgi:hypothetical protein
MNTDDIIEDETRNQRGDLTRLAQTVAVFGGACLLLVSSLPYIPYLILLLTPLLGELFSTEVYDIAEGLLPANLAVTTAASGVVLLVFGLNGRRLARLNVGDASFEADIIDDLDEPAPDEKLIQDATEKIETTPEPPTREMNRPTWEHSGWEFFKITAVETKTIRKLVSVNWGREHIPPTLGQIEFAFKKDARNSTWHFKIRGMAGSIALVQGRGRNKGVNGLVHRDYGAPKYS